MAQNEYRRQIILEIKQILPYLGDVNLDLFRISASLRPDVDDDNQNDDNIVNNGDDDDENHND